MKTKPQYEIWHEGQINGPYDLEHLRALRESGWPSGALWRQCGTAQFSLPEELEHEFIPLPPQPAPTAPPVPSGPPVSEESSKDYLQRVRGSTNYKSLRSLIDVITIVYIIAVAIMGLASISGAFLSAGPAAFLLGGAIVVLAVFVLIGIRQSLLLVVDLADMSADQGRFKGQAGK